MPKIIVKKEGNKVIATATRLARIRLPVSGTFHVVILPDGDVEVYCAGPEIVILDPKDKEPS